MSRSTLVGIVVLGLVVAGMWWVRPPSPAIGHLPPASAGQASGDDALPDATFAAATVDAAGVKVTLSLSPNPPVAFAKTRVRVRAEAGGSPVSIENGRVSFEMSMPMGDHRYTLVPGEEGWLEAAVVLPT